MASSSSPAVRVDKATSELLLGPDWTLNIDICDAVNSDHGQAKEVIKALKKRLQHKNSKVQFFALTLLETLMKNCGDYVHSQVVERDILQEMIKIVKKKTDMQLRDKILVLLESWQEAFGGNGGKHPQYYWAYAEMKKLGLEFPRRSPDAAPILTPPITRPGSLEPYHQPSYGMPVNSSSRFDEAMSSSGPSLSSSDLEHMLSAVELLSEMLKAVNPHDRGAVSDEIITELVKQCWLDQKKIVSLVASLRDEELLGQALDLNDRMQILLGKHDAIASGSPLPDEETAIMNEAPAETISTPVATEAPRAAVASIVPTNVFDEEDEDEDDEFSQLACRNSKFRSTNAESTSSGVGKPLSTTYDGITSSESSATTTVSPPVQSNAQSLPDPPAPVRTAEEQVMSDLLALTIASNSSPPHTPPTPQAALNQGGSQANDHPKPSYSNQGLAAAPYNSYLAPWAQPQSQTAGVQLQQQPPPQSQLPYNSSPYPPPPWASEDTTESNPFIASSLPHTSTSSSSVNSPLNLRPLQQSHSFGVPLRNTGSQSPINGSTKQPMSAGARRPSYVSPNKHFDDLFEKNGDGSLMKVGSSIGGGTSSPYKA